MMIDLALLGQDCLKKFAGNKPERIYAMGLSNGGYQARRALEIDHKHGCRSKKRLFDGGVDWSGAYWPDKRVMDADGDGKVSVFEYAAADTLVGSIDKGTLAMGWFRSPDTLAKEDEYNKNLRTPPPLYDWLASATNGGWNKESVRYALKNANTGEFSVPMLSLQGQADGLVALNAQGLEYKDAVDLYGNPDLHRFYTIAHAGHVDKHVDGGWGANSTVVDPDIPDLQTPMQAYAQRTFEYLVAWVENGELPPDSKFVEADPADDITDPSLLDW